MLLKCFHSNDHNLQCKLFSAFVTPILEYNSPIWSPHFARDFKAIERVQKRLTKNIKGPRNKPYKECLAILDLPSTECRHSFNDLVFLNKIIHGLSDIKLQSLFSPANRLNVIILHRHSYQLYLPKPPSDLLKLAFVIESLNCGTLYLNTYVMLHLLLFLNSLRCLIYVK